MPRMPRITSKLNLYHICDRGVDKRAIFNDDTDREKFIKLLADVLQNVEGSLIAWCLMTNHIHLVVQMDKDEMSQMMQSLVGRYAQFYNWRHGRSGYLIQDRFRSQPINTQRYLLTAVRYVHQNPVKAGMTPTCAYPWSSYSEYLHGGNLCDTSLVLGEVGGIAGFLLLHSCEREREEIGLLDVDNGWVMSKDDVWAVACRAIGREQAKRLDKMGRQQRDECIRALLRAHIRSDDVADLAKVSASTVYRVKRSIKT